MKRSTLVVCSIACFLELKGSDGVPAIPRQTGPTPRASPAVDARPTWSPPVASLLTALCSSATLDNLPPPALVSIANTLSATPQLFDALPPTALVALLSAVSSSPSALNELSPVALLVLIAAVCSAAPSSSVPSVPPSAMFPLLEKLTLSGLLPPSGRPPNAVFAQLPALLSPPPQVIVPGPAPGPVFINLPEPLPKPPPIVVQSGPPPSIVVSVPRPCPAPPPLIAPQVAPGPIVITENQNATRLPSVPIVIPAPVAPNIYFTTHPSKTCPRTCYPQLEMPKVYALPPGVSPAHYFQTSKKRS